MNDWAEDNRLAVCPVCGVREAKMRLYYVCNRLMCNGRGQDEIRLWNEAVLSPPPSRYCQSMRSLSP